MPAEQVHDYNPGILQNGLFWTIALPEGSFTVGHRGRSARLQVTGLPMTNTFVFANNFSVASALDVDVTWNAIGPRIRRGFGTTVPPDDFGAFQGRFAEATCAGTVRSAHTGFSFDSGVLDASGFFAEMGEERNGVFMT